MRAALHKGVCARAVLAACSTAAAFGAIPETGPVVQELRAIDDAMQGFMASHKFEAGTLTLLKDSKLVFRQGYGWRDVDKSSTTHPDNLFRLASVSKMFTVSAIFKLVNDGKLSADTKIYSYLGITPWRGVLGDSRINDITVQMLLDHKGGWDNTVSAIGDPVHSTVRISLEMALDHPASASEVISWVFSKPLDFVPGAKSVYSNFGFQVLGRVVEKASGKSFMNYVQQDLLGQFPVKVFQSRSRPADRYPWEIWYTDTEPLTLTAVDFPAKNLVHLVDGGFYYESYDSFGGITAAAGDLCRYLLAYWEGGARRDPNSSYSWDYTFYGSLTANTTILRQKITQNAGNTAGLEYAALFNNRTNGGNDNDDARAAIENAVAGVSSWPASGGGVVQWATDTTQVSKRSGTVTILLARSGGNTTATSASYATYARSADALDFVSTAGVVAFAAGETVKPVTFSILDNARVDASRDFSVELISVAGGASLGDRVSSTIRILNNAGSASLKQVNSSTRVLVGSGENVLTTGIALTGAGTKSYLVRGVGPSLSKFGVTGALANPVLKVFDSNSQVIATSSGWDSSLASTFTAVGAFALQSGSTDAAVVVTLGPGTYTIQISGASNSSGVALAEIYELP